VDLAKRQESLVRQVFAANAEREKATTAHAEALLAAVGTSKPIPAKPEAADLSHLDAAMIIQRDAEEAHRDQRTVVLAEIAARSGGVVQIRPVRDEFGAFEPR
jgi:hypothetical protein